MVRLYNKYRQYLDITHYRQFRFLDEVRGGRGFHPRWEETSVWFTYLHIKLVFWLKYDNFQNMHHDLSTSSRERWELLLLTQRPQLARCNVTSACPDWEGLLSQWDSAGQASNVIYSPIYASWGRCVRGWAAEFSPSHMNEIVLR